MKKDKTTKSEAFCRLGFFPKNPRAQIASQFAWIFILIAGAVILIFFLTIVFKQKALSEQKLSAEVVNQLETILAGAEVSSGTINVIDTPELKMELICDEDGFSTYFVNNIDGPEDFPQVIFSPDTIEGRQLITWTLEWSAPFKVMNFLYLSDPNIKYVLISPDQEVKKTFPDEFEPKILESSDELFTIDPEGFNKIRLVFFSPEDPINAPPSLQMFQAKETEISAVHVTPGSVQFYRRSGNSFAADGNPIPYLDPASMYGAIFSQDATYYGCNMKKALKRLDIIAQIYAERETALVNHFGKNTGCGLFYHEDTAALVQQLNTCSSQNLEQCIFSIRTTIGNDNSGIIQNQNTLLRQSCPLLY